MMTKEQFIEEIKKGNYKIEQECYCHCDFEWEIDEDGQIEEKTKRYDELCWVSKTLIVNGVDIFSATTSYAPTADHAGFNTLMALDEIEELSAAELENFLSDLYVDDDDYEENAEHFARRKESLREFLNEMKGSN